MDDSGSAFSASLNALDASIRRLADERAAFARFVASPTTAAVSPAVARSQRIHTPIDLDAASMRSTATSRSELASSVPQASPPGRAIAPTTTAFVSVDRLPGWGVVRQPLGTSTAAAPAPSLHELAARLAALAGRTAPAAPSSAVSAVAHPHAATAWVGSPPPRLTPANYAAQAVPGATVPPTRPGELPTATRRPKPATTTVQRSTTHVPSTSSTPGPVRGGAGRWMAGSTHRSDLTAAAHTNAAPHTPPRAPASWADKAVHAGLGAVSTTRSEDSLPLPNETAPLPVRPHEDGRVRSEHRPAPPVRPALDATTRGRVDESHPGRSGNDETAVRTGRSASRAASQHSSTQSSTRAATPPPPRARSVGASRQPRAPSPTWSQPQRPAVALPAPESHERARFRIPSPHVVPKLPVAATPAPLTGLVARLQRDVDMLKAQSQVQRQLTAAQVASQVAEVQAAETGKFAAQALEAVSRAVAALSASPAATPDPLSAVAVVPPYGTDPSAAMSDDRALVRWTRASPLFHRVGATSRSRSRSPAAGGRAPGGSRTAREDESQKAMLVAMGRLQSIMAVRDALAAVLARVHATASTRRA